MKFTILKKLKHGDVFRKVLHRDGSVHCSKKEYYFDGYDKKCKSYFYYDVQPDFCVEYDNKTGEILVVVEV